MDLQSIIQTVGYPAVFFFIMGESAGVPMPGETAVLIASAAAGANGTFNIWAVIAVAAAGAICGDTMGYWIGRRGGRPLIERMMRRFHVNPEHLTRAEGFFAKHGGKAVFFGRSVSYLRVLSALLAGVSHMHYPKFLFYNAAGGIVWAFTVGMIGHTFGKNWPLIETYIGRIGWGALVVIGVVVIAVLLFRKKKTKSKSEPQENG